ncbi:MAG TPA: hypothetical protein PL137_22285 [Nocardioides sp.]|nr:hypothetical protein [Nocardioides sp.]
MQMVGMQVRHQHRRRSVDRLGLGEHPRIENHHLTVVLDPDAGVAELGDPHEPIIPHPAADHRR